MKQSITFDEKDKKILTMFSRNPEVSQEAIGEEIGMKQPSVAVRIRKLKGVGALELLAGVDPFKLGLQMAKIDVTTTNPSKVLKLFETMSCIFVEIEISLRRILLYRNFNQPFPLF